MPGWLDNELVGGLVYCALIMWITMVGWWSLLTYWVIRDYHRVKQGQSGLRGEVIKVEQINSGEDAYVRISMKVTMEGEAHVLIAHPNLRPFGYTPIKRLSKRIGKEYEVAYNAKHPDLIYVPAWLDRAVVLLVSFGLGFLSVFGLALLLIFGR